MGKKIMENWVNHLIQASISAIMILFAFWLSSSKMSAQIIQETFDTKADKTELIRFKSENTEQHKDFVRKDQFEEFKDGLNTILDYIKKSKKDD